MNHERYAARQAIFAREKEIADLERDLAKKKTDLANAEATLAAADAAAAVTVKDSIAPEPPAIPERPRPTTNK
jgi:hypothetical protein